MAGYGRPLSPALAVQARGEECACLSTGRFETTITNASTVAIIHISALKRDLMKRKIKKLQRAGDWS